MGFLDSFKKQPSVADLQAKGDVNGLTKALLEPDGKQAMEAGKALAAMGGEAGVLALLQAVTQADPAVRMAGALYLGTISDPRALPMLLKVGADASLPTPVRTLAVQSIGSLKSPAAVGPLTALLGDAVPEVKTGAAYALGWIGVADEKAAAALFEMCSDARQESRHAATVGLASIGDPRALPFVDKLLGEEKEPGSRVEVIRALGALGGPEAVSRLTALLDSPADQGLRTEIQAALEKARASGTGRGSAPQPAAEQPAAMTADRIPAVAVACDAYIQFDSDEALNGFATSIVQSKWPGLRLAPDTHVEGAMGISGGDDEARTVLDDLLDRAMAAAGVDRAACEVTYFTARSEAPPTKVWCMVAVRR